MADVQKAVKENRVSLCVSAWVEAFDYIPCFVPPPLDPSIPASAVEGDIWVRNCLCGVSS